ncbi:MAG: bifunctional folylpolyglutamate synthase/dihydrofolate synthase [Mucilaginibacter sp.]
MDYKTTLDYLYSQLPMFTRDGPSAFKKDLGNTLELCKRLGDPQRRFNSVHVAGTNGKGSTSHMLAAILQTAGYRTGLYTSPHLRDFRERIRIDGEMITEQHVIDFVEQHKKDFEEIRPSFFEMTVGMAFEAFALENVDIAVIEVGLGGRLDSTNIITPLLSVITNIGWDHTNMLGNTLQLIAGEKAGIIKPGIPVIVGEYQTEVADVFINKAKEQNAPISFASSLYSLKSNDNASQEFLDIEIQKEDSPLTNYKLQLDLTGIYQLKNVKTVLSAVDELRCKGFNITDEHIQTALSQVKKLTGLHGRWEILSHDPLTICDTGHNPEGIADVMKNIEAIPHDHLHFVMGVVNDKDISKILAMLPKKAAFYFCRPDIPRGLDAEILRQQATGFDLHGDTYPSVKAALAAAQSKAVKNDLVFVGGSTFVVAEII